MELGPEDVSLLERCPHFRGCYVQASMELGPEDVSLLERCPHFRGCYVQASMELGPADVSLLERCPHFRGCYVQSSMELGCVPIREVSHRLFGTCHRNLHVHTMCVFTYEQHSQSVYQLHVQVCVHR